MSDEIVELIFVTSRQGINDSFKTFNRGISQDYDLARSLLRTTSYWVYHPSNKMFGPSKFLGFRGMTFSKYKRARQGRWQGARFNGQETRKAIEKLIGQYEANPVLSESLIEWGENLLGVGVFEGVDRNKWKFVSL